MLTSLYFIKILTKESVYSPSQCKVYKSVSSSIYYWWYLLPHAQREDTGKLKGPLKKKPKAAATGAKFRRKWIVCSDCQCHTYVLSIRLFAPLYILNVLSVAMHYHHYVSVTNICLFDCTAVIQLTSVEWLWLQYSRNWKLFVSVVVVIWKHVKPVQWEWWEIWQSDYNN